MSLWRRDKWFWTDFGVNGVRHRVPLEDTKCQRIPADDDHREMAACAEEREITKPVYARLRAPGGDGTIALDQAGPEVSVLSDGVRLYFEVRELDNFCRNLQQKGFHIIQLPRVMPWGWRHAYLNDPDGHEISLYWAGENRMKKTVMKAAQRTARA